MPWENLSESSEEEYSPRRARHTVEDMEEEDEHPEANGSAVSKAPAPEAAEAPARAMSIGDQVVFKGKSVAELLQVSACCTFTFASSHPEPTPPFLNLPHPPSKPAPSSVSCTPVPKALFPLFTHPNE